jgi:DNA polymerase
MVDLKSLNKSILKCKKCELCKSRTNAVPGEGEGSARILLIGEAPGRSEDSEGRPFVGRAGKTLNDILDNNDIERGRLFITNIVKCRPPKNRVPKKPEIEACRGYLLKQIELLKPHIIIALGQSAFKTLTGLEGNLRDLRGKEYNFFEYPVLVTYHPAAVIYNRKLKPELESDFEEFKKYYSTDD